MFHSIVLIICLLSAYSLSSWSISVRLSIKTMAHPNLLTLQMVTYNYSM